MSLELSDIPKNVVVYIDANIFIKEKPSVLTKASNSFMFIEKMGELSNLDIVAYSREIAFLALTLAKTYFLLSNDATHLSTMKTHGISDIATNDPDFERAEGVKVWKS